MHAREYILYAYSVYNKLIYRPYKVQITEIVSRTEICPPAAVATATGDIDWILLFHIFLRPLNHPARP